jgi:transcriptional regulator with XRE-family HTH domain
MAKEEIILLPKYRKILVGLGQNLRLARLRRKFSAQQVAQRANISRNTLHTIEKGSAGTSIGLYLQVMAVLGLENDFLLLGKDDQLGRKLQDAEIQVKQRAPKRTAGNE